AVCQQVGRRRPVSAALGELRTESSEYPGPGLTYVKWGLSGCLAQADWRTQLTRAAQRQQRGAPGCRVGAGGYADWQQAGAPPPAEVCAFACQQGWGVFLLDTWGKNGRTLFDWLSPSEIERLCRCCRRTGVRIALAGSLGLKQMRRLQEAQPDWFAVRGAVCHQGHRTGAIDPDRVRELVDWLRRV